MCDLHRITTYCLWFIRQWILFQMQMLRTENGNPLEKIVLAVTDPESMINVALNKVIALLAISYIIWHKHPEKRQGQTIIRKRGE